MRWFRLLAAALALAVLVGVSAAKPSPEPVRFTILHFNDFHGQVEPLAGSPDSPTGGMARLAGEVAAARADCRQKGEPAFLLFAGDLFTGTSFSTLFQGAPEFQALSLMRLTAMTTGNHEWDFGQGVLMARARRAGFPIVLDNVSTPDPEHAFWTRAVDLRAGGTRIGVIGVTTPDTPQTTAPGNTEGYAFLDPVKTVGEILAVRGRSWDFVIVVSHCGFEVDKALADRYPQLGLIVGGHDHKVIEHPITENGVPIVQAGDRGRFLGRVEVELRKGSRAAVTGRLIPVTAASPADKSVGDLLAPFLQKEGTALGEVIGRLPLALSGDRALLRSSEAPIGDLLTDAMRAEAKADVALLNAGTIRAGLPEGPVTGRDLLACLPFFDSLCTVRLTGAQIQSLLDKCASMPAQDAPGGFLQVSGLSARYAGGKALDLRIGGLPVVPEREYVVACSHFLLSGGDGLVEFKQGRDVRDFGLSLQEILRRLLTSPGLAVPEAGGRIVREKSESQREAA